MARKSETEGPDSDEECFIFARSFLLRVMSRKPCISRPSGKEVAMLVMQGNVTYLLKDGALRPFFRDAAEKGRMEKRRFIAFAEALAPEIKIQGNFLPTTWKKPIGNTLERNGFLKLANVYRISLEKLGWGYP